MEFMCLERQDEKRGIKSPPDHQSSKEAYSTDCFPFLFLLFYFILFYYHFSFSFLFVCYFFALFFLFPRNALFVLYVNCVGSHRKLGQQYTHLYRHVYKEKSNKLFWILANIVNNSCGIAFESWRHKRAHTNKHTEDTRGNDSSTIVGT